MYKRNTNFYYRVFHLHNDEKNRMMQFERKVNDTVARLNTDRRNERISTVLCISIIIGLVSMPFATSYSVSSFGVDTSVPGYDLCSKFVFRFWNNMIIRVDAMDVVNVSVNTSYPKELKLALSFPLVVELEKPPMRVLQNIIDHDVTLKDVLAYDYDLSPALCWVVSIPRLVAIMTADKMNHKFNRWYHHHKTGNDATFSQMVLDFYNTFDFEQFSRPGFWTVKPNFKFE